MNFVYLTTNLINNKQYVGSHKGEEKDNYFGSGDIIIKSQKKYGKENFKKEILEITETREEAFLLEEKYIRLLQTHASQGGYNISWTGGMGSWGGSHSNESKEKISKASKLTWDKLKSSELIKLKDRNNKISNKLKGRIKSDEWIEKWKKNVNVNGTFIGKKNPMYGKTQLASTKQLISKKNKGNSNCGGRKNKVFATYLFYNNNEFIEKIEGQQNAKQFCKNNQISFQSLCKKSDKWKTWYCKRNKLNKNDNK
jgi:group I intron endonuclease